jgi:hypothetical protein
MNIVLSSILISFSDGSPSFCSSTDETVTYLVKATMQGTSVTDRTLKLDRSPREASEVFTSVKLAAFNVFLLVYMSHVAPVTARNVNNGPYRLMSLSVCKAKSLSNMLQPLRNRVRDH